MVLFLVMVVKLQSLLKVVLYLYCISIYLHIYMCYNYLDGSLSGTGRKTTKSIEGSFVFVLY